MERASSSHLAPPLLRRRRFLGLLAAGLALPPQLALADRWAPDTDPGLDTWASTNTAEVTLRAAPRIDGERMALLRTGTRLRILGQDHDLLWAHVLDVRSGAIGYVRRDLLDGADAPSWYAYKSAPPLDAEFSTIGIATQDVPLYFYPAPDDAARATVVEAGGRETIVGSVTGADGASWLATDDGYFMPTDNMFMADAPDQFGGRWLDVSLSGLARVVALDTGDPVRSFYAIKGTAKFPTPMGAWSIVRRVANETMDSSTLGIPNNGPGWYLLKNVLYTQYFRGTGESLHYNWWSSAWGTPGSHGCLGLSLSDAKWLWDWADIGTPVLIHA